MGGTAEQNLFCTTKERSTYKCQGYIYNNLQIKRNNLQLVWKHLNDMGGETANFTDVRSIAFVRGRRDFYRYKK